jgi:hypothetical protein
MRALSAGAASDIASPHARNCSNNDAGNSIASGVSSPTASASAGGGGASVVVPGTASLSLSLGVLVVAACASSGRAAVGTASTGLALKSKSSSAAAARGTAVKLAWERTQCAKLCSAGRGNSDAW